jgi:hypothetical protein
MDYFLFVGMYDVRMRIRLTLVNTQYLVRSVDV